MRIRSRRVWLAGQFYPAAVEFKEGKITDILPYESDDIDRDYGTERVLPGIIDIHCHGAYDYDTNDAEEEGLRYWSRHIVEEGVTSFLSTTVTDSEERLMRAVGNVAKVMKEGYEGAEILGIHLEGPYLSAKYKGAQPQQYIVKGNIGQFQRLQEAAEGHIRYITLAPEEDEDYRFIDYLSSHGVVVSLGHTAATYDQAMLAWAHGAKSMTHVYNGMSGFTHRANNMVGAAFRMKDMYGEIIADCAHSTAVALNLFAQAKGPDHTIMVTDSLKVKGLPVGTKRMFAGRQITIAENGLALQDDGSISGSTLRSNIGLRNMIEEALIPVETAINAATINPARCLGIDERKGSIQVGKDADIIVLKDDYSLVQTYARGKEWL